MHSCPCRECREESRAEGLEETMVALDNALAAIYEDAAKAINRTVFRASVTPDDVAEALLPMLERVAK